MFDKETGESEVFVMNADEPKAESDPENRSRLADEGVEVSAHIDLSAPVADSSAELSTS